MLCNLKFSFATCMASAILLTTLIPVAAGATVFLLDDVTGGDCENVGAWEGGTKTCTLETDVFETIELAAPGLKLNCANHTITATGALDAVFIGPGAAGSTVRRCRTSLAEYGITAWLSGGHSILDNECNNSLIGILLFESDGNIISDNTLSSNDYGIYGAYASYGLIRDNIINTDQHGVYLYESTRIEVSGNSIEGPGAAYAYPYGRGVWVYGGSGDIDVINNYISDTFIPINVLEWPENILISGNIVDTGVWGISTEIHHSTIENNDITGMSYISIDVVGSDNIIANNHVHESTVLRVHSFPIEGGEAHRNIVENNIVENGLACEEPCYTFTYQNEMGILISSMGSQRDFGNNVYGEGLTDENVIRGNIIRNMVGEGIYLDSAGNNNMVTNNVITQNAGGGITIAHPCSDCNYNFIRNDVYHNGGLPLRSIDTEITGLGTGTWTRNELGPEAINVAGQDDLGNTIGNWWNGNCGTGLWQASFSNDPSVYDSNPYRHAVAKIPVDIAAMPKVCPP